MAARVSIKCDHNSIKSIINYAESTFTTTITTKTATTTEKSTTIRTTTEDNYDYYSGEYSDEDKHKKPKKPGFYLQIIG